VRNKLQSATPLALASNIPPDVAAVLENDPTYPQLFEAAFGTPDITAERIAFAIATYERTLVPDQTPWDRFNAGDENAMTEAEKRGFDAFTATNSQCGVCHTGSQFTTHDFQNVGVRPVTEDRGRAEVTGNSADNGRFRAPSLRNVGLQNRFMHNGRFTTLEQVIDFYRRVNGQTQFPGADPVVAQISMTDQQAADLVEFLRTGLTDPRAAAEIFPFDRPTLRSELLDGDLNCDGVVTVSDISPFVLLLTDPAAYNAMFPDCSAAAADLNLDGLISVSDIGAFVGLLTGA
jgi:cytochrome c peroxidase